MNEAAVCILNPQSCYVSFYLMTSYVLLPQKRFNIDRGSISSIYHICPLSSSLTQVSLDQLRFEYHGVAVRGNEDDTPEAVRVPMLFGGAVSADAT